MADLILKIPFPYEPKMKDRWVIKIDNRTSTNNSRVQEWVIKESSRPKFKRTKWWNFWNKFEVDTISIIMNDPICPSTAQNIYNFMVNDTILDYNLEMLDPTGVVVEIWEVRGCKILEADFGGINFKDGDMVTCTLLLKPHTAKLLF